MEEFINHPGWWKFGLDVIQTIALAVVGVYVFVTKRTQANRNEINNLYDRFSQIDAQIKEHIAGSSTKKDVEILHSRVTEILGLVRKLEGEMSGVKNLVDTLNRHHIK